MPGICLEKRRSIKEKHYADIVNSPNLHFLVLGCETGGRFDPECISVIRMLAKAKARGAPPLLKDSVEFSLIHRWSSVITVAAQNAYASSLLDADPVPPVCSEDTKMKWSQIIEYTKYEDTSDFSRLPCR